MTAALATLVVMLVPRAAHAQPQWINGTAGYTPGTACVTFNPETEVTSYAGYWGSPDASFPLVGDTSYVHGVAAVVGNPCSGGDPVGFDFFPPVGATLAITAQNPVKCFATRLSDGFTTSTDPNIHCSQTPSIGNAGGLFFGFATLPHGWAFEIQVPVEFTQALHGTAGPSNEWLWLTTSSTNGMTTVNAPMFVPAPPPTVLPSRSFALNQQIAFTGTGGAGASSQGPFTAVPAATTAFSLATTRNLDVRFNFIYVCLSGPSQMNVDVRFLIDGVEFSRTRATCSTTSVDALASAVHHGNHTLTVEARGVLINGPPTPVTLEGDRWGDPAVLTMTGL